MEESTEVAIIGAGPAGLAVCGCLKRAGIDFVMLEKEAEPASSWRGHYDRLHLHTIGRFSALPFAPFPKGTPRYVPRLQFIDYLDGYAKRFGLVPRFGERVSAVNRAEKGWIVESTLSRLRADFVVVASGYNAVPNMPALPGLEQFAGKVLHSTAYRDGSPFAGQSVLVVGMGNTGAELVLDLAEAGARPTLSVRGGVHVVPRELFGVPIQLVGMLSRPMPRWLNDAVFPFILDMAQGNLARLGLKRPDLGLLEQIATASRIPVVDIGTVKAIAAGAIAVAPDIAEIGEREVRFKDGRRQAFDAIILATGFRPGYRQFLPADIGEPRSGVNGKASADRLYLVGFNNVVTGLLREIGGEAKQVAKDIMLRR